MKTWKQGFIGFLVVIALIFNACDDGNGNKDTHTHNYSTTWLKDATNHWHECSCGDKTDVAPHTTGDWIIDQSATATTAGSKHKECTMCGFITETEAIPVIHNHQYSTTWSKDATQHWHECSCGNKTDITPHDWEWVETTPATATADGLATETCTVCGATNGTRPIEQTEPALKDFTITDLDFGSRPSELYPEHFSIAVLDARTNCGSTNLEDLGIVDQLEQAIKDGFNDGTGFPAVANKNKFRVVFWYYSVTIIVDNPATAYKMKAPNQNTIYVHISYLQSNQSELYQNIIDVVQAIYSSYDNNDTALPFEVE